MSETPTRPEAQAPKKIEAWQKERGLTKADLAKRWGISAPSVARILEGRQTPGQELMRRIVEDTRGCVQPNDFYPIDYSRLRPRAAAPAAGEATA